MMPFNGVQMNEYCSKELLVLNSNTWNHFSVWKQMIDIK